MARFIYSPDPITYSEAEYQDGKPYRDAQRIKSDFEKKYPDIIKPIYQKNNQYSQGTTISTTFQFPRARGKYVAIC